MILVGITGFRRCGKNSAAAVLERYGFRTYGFADALREMALAIDPMISLAGAPFDQVLQLGQHIRYSELLRLVGYESAKDVPDMRRYLQKLGTDGVRTTFGPHAWVNALAYRIERDAPERAVIADVRFMSESDWIYQHGGRLWRVNRPGYGGDDPHPSERDIPNLPAVIDIVASNLAELDQAVTFAIKETWPTLQEVPRAKEGAVPDDRASNSVGSVTGGTDRTQA